MDGRLEAIQIKINGLNTPHQIFVWTIYILGRKAPPPPPKKNLKKLTRKIKNKITLTIQGAYLTILPQSSFLKEKVFFSISIL